MSYSENEVRLIGRLAEKPELRYTKNGKPVTRMRLITSREFKTSAGEERKEIEGHNVVLWDRQAENACEYLDKGQEIKVDGRLHYTRWNDPQGNTHYFTEIHARRVQYGAKARTKTEMPEEVPAEDSAPSVEEEAVVKVEESA